MQNYGFYNGDALYGQEEFNMYFDNMYESGVSIDGAGDMTFKVTASGNRQFQVSPGFAIVRGFYLYNDSVYTGSIVPDAASRIDRVVIRAGLVTGPVEIAVRKGNAAASPKVPALVRNGDIYEISLARILVAPNGTLSVTDERADNRVCGAIRPKNLTEYKTMVEGFRKRWEEWFADQVTRSWRNMHIQREEPVGSVEGSIWIRTDR